jgi:hypothetical protein
MALLIGEWVGTKCSQSARTTVYESLLGLLTPLDPRNDVVVRMVAADGIRKAVDDWHFVAASFAPYLEAVLVGVQKEHNRGGILGLMRSVEHIESKMKLILVVEVVIERVDRKV